MLERLVEPLRAIDETADEGVVEFDEQPGQAQDKTSPTRIGTSRLSLIWFLDASTDTDRMSGRTPFGSYTEQND